MSFSVCMRIIHAHFLSGGVCPSCLPFSTSNGHGEVPCTAVADINVLSQFASSGNGNNVSTPVAINSLFV